MLDNTTLHDVYLRDIKVGMAMLWEKFRILNVIVLMSHCCKKDHYIYIHHHFEENKSGTLGVFRMHPLNKLFDNRNLTIKSGINLKRFNLKVSMFPRSPTAIRIDANCYKKTATKDLENPSGFIGLDGNILNELAKIMNFTVQMSNFSNHTFYGVPLQNGTVIGSLGAVVNSIVDLATNGRFITKQEYNYVEFTVPYANDKICIIAPKSEKIPHWVETFRGFGWDVWLLLFGSISFSLLVWYTFQNIEFDKSNVNKVWMDIFSIFLNVPVKVVGSTPGRNMFLVSCYVFMVIFTGIFQGNLVRSFSATSYYAEINTLEELDNSGLKILTSLNIFNNNESSLFERLQSNVIDRNESAKEAVAYHKNVVALERKKDANLFKYVYVTREGIPLLHVVQECPISYHLAFIVTEGSPYLPRFNQLIRRMFESGLTEKWYNDVVECIIMKEKFKNSEDGKKVKPFTLYDMQLPFIVLILGVTSSICVFTYEFYLLRSD
jgi:ABC-type amino acid transport substrate-binding protein